MSPTGRFRTSFSGSAALLAFLLVASFGASAQEQADDPSGYASVEASRAAIGVLVVLPDGPTCDASGGDRAVDPNRMVATRRALQSNHLGSMQEEALTVLVATCA